MSVLSGETELKNDVGNQDQIIHLQNLPAGEYTINVTSPESGNGILKIYNSLPELPIGGWVVEKVLRPYGSVFNQVTVPSNQDVLKLNAQAMGGWSNFRVFRNTWGSKETWIGTTGPDANVLISKPKSGLFLVSFQDVQMVTA